MTAAAALAASPTAAFAQESHAGGGRLPTVELLAGVTHGIVQGAAVLLVGLVAFVALVWLPISRAAGTDGGSGAVFARGAWALFAALALVGLADVAVYTAWATGRPLGLGLYLEGLFGTTAGQVALARLGTGLLVAFAVAWAAGGGGIGRWWAAAGAGGLLLATLVPESHAVAQGLLAITVIWLHLVAAAFWTGGLLAFPILLLGPLRALGLDERADLRRRTVRRFSKVATVAVLVLVATGLYSTLLNVAGLGALVGTAYGRALVMKLGMTVLLLATGGLNLIDKGDGPLGRMVGLELALAAGIFVAAGFLTSLPPAN
ncbi:hypothetical protein GBA63_01070 [Rubrobacter tropicus]|uniref:Copper resistance protein D domain-containing protein n=1 Tax=Rubrobacter tropicus TaxID=2653851 RepID=A0A6G8Q4L7_9ACTN|nr:CopD family protein [Rubrobacter tropicus]QIN81369.1 hypothetical protein GBA63_01070 [Rubrobacter tropicus]